METTINAAQNPALANDVISKTLSENEKPKIEPAEITAPTDIVVELPGGLVTTSGEVIKTATVRELNGRDEEAIIKADTPSKMFTIILNRGTSLVGDSPATEDLLDQLLIGDRDAILLGIYRATFGPTSEQQGWCSGCKTYKPVIIDIVSDIKSKVLTDPENETRFYVKGKSKEFFVALPNGATQKKMLANPDATLAETLTSMLEHCVLQIDGQPVFSKLQTQTLGITDRRKIADEIADRNPGPLFNDIKVTCPDCESEVVVPINLGTLFRF